MIGSKPAWTALLGASALLIASLAFTAPARAEDDGYEPLWDGIGGALGILPKKDQEFHRLSPARQARAAEE